MPERSNHSPQQDGAEKFTETFTIARNKFSSDHHMKEAHFHDGYEIYYSMAGEKNYFIKDKMYRVCKGDLLFIDRYELHKATSTSRLERERVLVYFKTNLFDARQHLLQDPLSPFHAGSPVLSLPVHEQKFVEELFHKMIEEYRDRRRNYLLCIEALLAELLVFAIRCNEKRLENPASDPKSLHPKITEAMQYITQHYTERLTLGMLAEKFTTSPYYLSRLFKTMTGFSFVDYIAAVRIMEAQKLLRDTNRNVIRIAEEVGFDNLAHFYKTFKKLAFASPLQYRKMHR
ncbi:helix-turn-helix domain-containing protein [Paenibacillus mesophilus]|uniref:AraC family transcriptional regulator n=1 Tax=Paenibacillus mesophilus TaxID=2582849 RepID=UPI00110E8D2D|nr:AraC family transcriptional regulator [Paenibacillus mesophilus]TMV47639.1 helix-turn-helix domain-containing protein [Paenibacillus mesophilus]